jgi:hypothetical protein
VRARSAQLTKEPMMMICFILFLFVSIYIVATFN